MSKLSGIYKITNMVTGDFYIGSSKDIKHRWARHKCISTWTNRPGMKLYKAFIKYGLDNFIFEVIEETNNLKEREQYWINKLNPIYNNYRAIGQDIERYKETGKQASKEYYKYHRDEVRSYMKEHYKLHKEEYSAYSKKYNNSLCLYEGEMLTLNALGMRFRRQGIPHPTLEAKKYLLKK